MIEENLFFKFKDLKRCGKNVIIGKTVRIRYPELVEIGDNVIIDDFVYISTALKIHNNVHISSGCKIIGGRKATVEMHRFSTLSPNVVLSAGSDDYSSGIATPMVPLKYKARAIIGTIILNRHCIIGSNSVVLPNVSVGEGTTVGALSLVKHNISAWEVFAGIPARKIGIRNREEVLKLERQYIEETGNG